MVSVSYTFSTIEVVSPGFKGEDDSTEFKIACRVVLLVYFGLPRSIDNHLSSLHEYTNESLYRSVIVYNEVF